MKLDIIGLVSACSYALDCIEAELVHVTNHHGKRVAYISVCMAEYFGIRGDSLQDLAICALLHDNALTQYISEEVEHHSQDLETNGMLPKGLGIHCIYGEQNIRLLPFQTDVSHVILYHHEHADGTGPFHKKWTEVPLFARIIHLADMVDIIGNSDHFSSQRWTKVTEYLTQNTDTLFDADCVTAFFDLFSEEDFASLNEASLETRLWSKVPREKQTFDYAACKNIADFFAQIIDYKSEFTGKHSLGVASKAAALSEYMGYDPVTVQKMYLAGALHDIGKMAIGNEILEKPGRLTDAEFASMQNHAGFTYLILSDIEDFEEIRDWAAFHHEKLNGKGYPFGKNASQLNQQERIMACIDIYQALTEARPYKNAMTHDQACDVLMDMAQKGFIDSDISKKIRECFQPSI